MRHFAGAWCGQVWFYAVAHEQAVPGSPFGPNTGVRNVRKMCERAPVMYVVWSYFGGIVGQKNSVNPPKI
jgi:hypothetical protein